MFVHVSFVFFCFFQDISGRQWGWAPSQYQHKVRKKRSDQVTSLTLSLSSVLSLSWVDKELQSVSHLLSVCLVDRGRGWTTHTHRQCRVEANSRRDCQLCTLAEFTQNLEGCAEGWVCLFVLYNVTSVKKNHKIRFHLFDSMLFSFFR